MPIYGNYETEHELGRGASGITYAARDLDTQQQVAVKVLVLAHTLQGAERAAYIERFMREANAAGLVQHPGVPEMLAVGQEGDDHFIAMEYCPGKTLQQVLNDTGAVPIHQAILIVSQVLGVLEAAHAAGIYHRDIKPDNIMLSPDGNSVKVMDFGIARLVGDNTITHTGSVIGTPSYLAPEQAMGKKVDGRADLFSAGVLLHELLTGLRPFNGSSFPELLHAIVYGEPEIAAGIPAPLSRIIRLALQKDPARRYEQAEQMRQALEHCLTASASLPGISSQSTIILGPGAAPDLANAPNTKSPPIRAVNLREAYIFCGAATAVLVSIGLLGIAYARMKATPEPSAPLRLGSADAALAPPPSWGTTTNPGFHGGPAVGFGQAQPPRPVSVEPSRFIPYPATLPNPATLPTNTAPALRPPQAKRDKPRAKKERQRSPADPLARFARSAGMTVPSLGGDQPLLGGSSNALIPPGHEVIVNPPRSPMVTESVPLAASPSRPQPPPAVPPPTPTPTSSPAAGSVPALNQAIATPPPQIAPSRNVLIPGPAPTERRTSPRMPKGEIWLDTRSKFYHLPSCRRAPSLMFRDVFPSPQLAVAAMRNSIGGKPYLPCPHCLKGEYQ